MTVKGEAPASAILRKEVQDQLAEIREADILIGIPSYNNANTIGHVVRAAQVGLAKYFPDKKAVIVNSDGGSSDNTAEVVHNVLVHDHDALMIPQRISPVEKIVTPYHGIPGKGSAFRTIFEIAKNLNVKACAVVDSDLRSITPEWFDLLLRPVLDKGFDFVAPYYLRHKYDGTITNSIVYPMTRALYGVQVRQPIGGDFGFSGNLAKHYLSKDVWETDVARFGIDIWMTTTAISDGFKVCQSFLGAKIHDAKDPGADLSAMLYQVVSAVFDLMDTYSTKWKDVNGSKPTEIFGFQYDVGLEPIHVDIERMIDKFELGLKELGYIWESFTSTEILYFLKGLKLRPWQEFRLPVEIWAEILYSFAIASHKKVFNREHLIKSLTPLYLGRVASFIIDNLESSAAEVEKDIERACQVFEDKKDFLVRNWDWEE